MQPAGKARKHGSRRLRRICCPAEKKPARMTANSGAAPKRFSLAIEGLLVLWLSVPLAGLRATTAAAQAAAQTSAETTAAQGAGTLSQTANTGQDFFKPPQNLFQLTYEYKTGPGNGSVPGTLDTVTNDLINLRLDHRIDFSERSLLALRSDLPLLAKNPFSAANPDGDYVYGVGDADAQAAYIYSLDKRLAVGVGARVTAPTGGDVFGTGKWQIMPLAGMRYGLWEISSSSYVEPVVRYAVSFAGDPSRGTISNLQIAPTLSFGLPDNWYFTLFPSPDIRVNFGDPVAGQTGRLFLPFDARVAHDLTDHIALSLELGVPIIKDYPVYDFKAEVRLNVTY
jgi:hypothetical protein